MKKILLSIPEPCHENWEQMSPCEKGRFCNACQKTVIDFTNMSDRQLAEFFKKAPASVCGHVHNDQLERIIDLPKKRIPGVKYFFQITLPAFLLSIKAYSQKTSASKTMVQTVSTEIIKTKQITAPSSFGKIEGVVVDSLGIPVAYASLKVKNSVEGIASDAEGKFSLQTNRETPVLVVTAIGYQSCEIKLTKQEPLKIVMQVKSAVMEEVVVTSNVSTSVGRLVSGAIWTITKERSLVQKIADTLSPAFSIYPNPVAKGSKFNIKLNKISEGDYVVSIIDSKGTLVRTSIITITGKKDVIEQETLRLSSGMYFIQLTNKKKGKSFTQKLIVQ